MPILRTPKNKNFTAVNNYFISNINLKPDGKGFLLYMLSKPNDWIFNYNNFEKELGIGKKAIRTIIKKLEDLKYLKRERLIGENGHYEWIYYVYEKPYGKKSPCSPQGYMVKGYILQGNIYKNTNITKDKIDKDNKINNKVIIDNNLILKKLIDEEYIDSDDYDIYKYDELIRELLNKYEYSHVIKATGYIISQYKRHNSLDEEGNKLINKYGYYKEALISNLKKINLEYDLGWLDDEY